MQLYEGLQRAPRPTAGEELRVREALSRGQTFGGTRQRLRLASRPRCLGGPVTHSLAIAQALRAATAALPECLDPVLSEARLWTGVPATFLLSVLTNGATACRSACRAA